MNWISTRVIKGKLERLSVLLLSNNIVIRFKDGKFTIGFYRFGEIRIMEQTQSGNLITTIEMATELVEQLPVLENLPTPTLSPIVYDLRKKVDNDPTLYARREPQADSD